MSYMATLTSLIHIGLGKAGSTYIQDYFRRHRSVRLFSPLNAICEHAASRASGARVELAPDISFSSASLDDPPVVTVYSDERLSVWDGGPAAAGRCDYELRRYQEAARDVLWTHFPEAYILLVTRNAFDWARSVYSQYVKSGGTMDFDAYLTDQDAFLKQGSDVGFLRGLYASRFGEDRLLVLPFEDLARDDSAFLKRICEFIGIDCEPPSETLRRNRGLSLDDLSFFREINRFVNDALASAPRVERDEFIVRYNALLRRFIGLTVERNGLALLDCSSAGTNFKRTTADRVSNMPSTI
jgi:hypothetical protein